MTSNFDPTNRLDEEGKLKPGWRIALEQKLSELVPTLTNKELYEKVFELCGGNEVESEYNNSYFTYEGWVVYSVHKEELDKRLKNWMNE